MCYSAGCQHMERPISTSVNSDHRHTHAMGRRQALRTAREALASARRLSRCACRAWILLWMMPLIPITNLLAKASRGEAALVTPLPPPKVSIPRDGACWGATRAHGDALSPLSGFEACQTELHGTSGTHGEYNHGRVQSPSLR